MTTDVFKEILYTITKPSDKQVIDNAIACVYSLGRNDGIKECMNIIGKRKDVA